MPPLLLQNHGGPTDEVHRVLDLNIQYWTSRGWAFVDVNYGGSSGYGKKFRERLLGSWGIVDVNDSCSYVKFLVDNGKVDCERLCITGCFAGGYTTLATLAFRETFKAGASLFGIADLSSLSADMHKFESHYIINLLGNEAALYERAIRNNTERRKLGFFSCGTGNPIDDCWCCDRNWEHHRKRLANCAIGFRRGAIGGRDGYCVVSNPNDDDPVNPKPGALRHAVIQDRPLWIVFKRSMVITLKQELIMNSFKTIDARGHSVHIANGGCITIHFITNVIIHGLNIHDCKVTSNAVVRSSPSHYGWRTTADGDAISIMMLNSLVPLFCFKD